MAILFSSCGRRVELLALFKRALSELGKQKSKIIAIDNDILASASAIADKFFLVPKIEEGCFISDVLNICNDNNVKVLIPLIDPELRVYAENKSLFEETGTNVIVSDLSVIEICSSKLETDKFYNSLNIPSIKTMKANDFLDEPVFRYPVIVKPCRGSGSKGVFTALSEDDIRVFIKYINEPVIQPKIHAPEITIDCLCDFEGKPINAVSRIRLETRAGESSKGKTFKDAILLDYAYKILDALKAIGPVTIQCFMLDDGYLFGEINPRFGGGYPLSHAAGANYPKLLLKMCDGENIDVHWGNYKDNIYFTRYDQSFFLKSEGKGQNLELEIFNGYEVDC